jgi:hypothetical protein
VQRSAVRELIAKLTALVEVDAPFGDVYDAVRRLISAKLRGAL